MGTVKIWEKCGLFAWSHRKLFPIYVASGSTAQQFDASFSAASTLEICELGLNSDDAHLTPLKSENVESRFHKLEWSEFGPSDYGLIIGGCDNGIINFYDPKKIFHNAPNQSSLFKQSRKHSGSVRALDVNPFQGKLLASGASNSEIFIWDLHNPDAPMSPGPKPQPLDQITSVAWSPNVEHILASLTNSHALVWDLRKSDGPIMKLGDLGSRVQWIEQKWHPNVPTSICLASAYDQFPVVQMWDVRFANAPCTSLEGHQRGILSMDWCPNDADLLVTCGKDSKIYVWNPNSGEFLAEITSNGVSWPYELKFCERNADLFGCASFDGLFSVYSLTSSGIDTRTAVSSPKLADSFPGADFSNLLAAQKQQQTRKPFALPRAPKWIAPKCGARFAFGGKLISFEQPSEQNAGSAIGGNPAIENAQRYIDVRSVSTDNDLYSKASELNELLTSSNVLLYAVDLCQKRADAATAEFEKKTWLFLRAHLERKPRSEYSKILGIDFESALLEDQKLFSHEPFRKIDVESNSPSSRELDDSYGSQMFRRSADESPVNGRVDDGDDLSDETVDEEKWTTPTVVLSNDLQSDASLLCRLVASGRYESAAELCIKENRWTDALQLALVAGSSFYKQVQRKYFDTCVDPMSKVITLIANEKWSTLASCVDLTNWQLTFSILLNYVQGRELTSYLNILGERLENETNPHSKANSLFCYICAGAIDKFASVLTKSKKSISWSNLHDLIEKAIVLRSSLGGGSQRVVEGGDVLLSEFCKYASILAEQGFLVTAFYLLDGFPEDIDDRKLILLRDRLYNACIGILPSNVKKPKSIFATASLDSSKRMTDKRQSITTFDKRPPMPPPSAEPAYNTWSSRPTTNVATQPPPVRLIPNTNFTRPSAVFQAPAVSNYQPMSPFQPAVNNYQPMPPVQPVGSNYQPQPQATSSYQPMTPFQPVRPTATVQPIANSGPPFRPSGPPPRHMMAEATWAMPAAPNVPPPPMIPPTNLPNSANPFALSANSQPPTQLIPPPPVTAYGAASSHSHIPPTKDRSRYPSYNSSVDSGAGYPTPHAPVHHHNYHHPSASGPSGHHRNVDTPLTPLTMERPSVDDHWNDPPPLTPKHVVSSQISNGSGALRHPYPSSSAASASSFVGNAMSSASVVAQQINQQAASARGTPVSVVEEHVPAEHEVLIQVFDRLSELLLAKAPNLQVRRRVEENIVKFDVHLKDQLIKQRLSTITLADLHEIVFYVQSHNYAEAIRIHAKLAQGRDFDNISGFMPALKVLLQTASQLNIFYS